MCVGRSLCVDVCLCHVCLPVPGQLVMRWSGFGQSWSSLWGVRTCCLVSPQFPLCFVLRIIFNVAGLCYFRRLGALQVGLALTVFYGYNVPVVKDQDFFLAVSPSFFHTNMESVIRVFPPATNYPYLVRPLEPSQARTMALWRKTIQMLSVW